MTDTKYAVCEFTTALGYSLAIDPCDIVGVCRGMKTDEQGNIEVDEDGNEIPETHIYLHDGSFWCVEDGYVEAVQVWIAAKTNNINL